jgi:hypothetical protein
MSISNKKTIYADKKSAIAFAILVSAWILGCADAAPGFGNTGGSAFRNDCRPLFSCPSRSTFGSYPQIYGATSRRYPEHNDKQALQIVRESSPTASASAASKPATAVSAASKPVQPETPVVAGQHEERDSDKAAKDVVKQKQAVAEPSALAEALKQYRILEWDRAGTLLKKSLEDGRLSTSEKFNACVLLGAMAYQLGQIDQAGTYFTKAHLLDPSATPSSELFPPQVVEFYKSVNRNIGE